MTLQQLALQAQATREAQKRYFRHRIPFNLAVAKAAEARLDKILAEILRPVGEQPPTLFGDHDHKG